jgi:uncharacterized protein (DUF58 family)
MNPRIPWLRRRRPLPTGGVRLSRGTVLFFMGTVMIGVVAVDTDANLLLLLFGLCVGSLLVSLASAWMMLRDLEVSRTAPPAVMAGQSFVIRYQITNRQRWISNYSLHLVDVVEGGGMQYAPEAYIPMLRPMQSMVLEVPVTATSRGKIDFNQIVTATRFPFALLTRFATASMPQTTIVYPRLGVVNERRWLSPHRADALSDSRSSLRRGDDEFYGLREYRFGDNPRRIHWRRSARTRTLMVREMARLGARQIWCVLDTRLPSDEARWIARLEEAISCAATIACDAIENKCKVGFVCNGEPMVVLPPASGREYRVRILRELALRAPNHDDALSERLARLTWPGRWRGSCLLIAARTNDDLSESAQILSRSVGPVTLYVAGTPAFDAIYRGPVSDRAAAEFGAPPIAERGESGTLVSAGRAEGVS